MAHPSHHYLTHHRLSKTKAKKAVDSMAYVLGAGGNLAVIPQIIEAWESDAPGLAITTWIVFGMLGFVWLTYAILHKQRPLIFAQATGIICNFLVVGGWMFNNWIR